MIEAKDVGEEIAGVFHASGPLHGSVGRLGREHVNPRIGVTCDLGHDLLLAVRLVAGSMFEDDSSIRAELT